MSTLWWVLLGLIVFLLVAVPLSMLYEALRRRPSPTQTLLWAPSLEIRHLDVGGNNLRYIQTGQGPPLVLLHTLRTQLGAFAVYCVMFTQPGHPRRVSFWNA